MLHDAMQMGLRYLLVLGRYRRYPLGYQIYPLKQPHLPPTILVTHPPQNVAYIVRLTPLQLLRLHHHDERSACPLHLVYRWIRIPCWSSSHILTVNPHVLLLLRLHRFVLQFRRQVAQYGLFCLSMYPIVVGITRFLSVVNDQPVFVLSQFWRRIPHRLNVGEPLFRSLR